MKLITKPTTENPGNFTPEYFFRSCHKFRHYFARAQAAFNNLKANKNVSSINFSWWISENGYYKVGVYGTMADRNSSPLVFTLFSTRYQKDACIALHFFQTMFNTMASPRINFEPGAELSLAQIRMELMKEMNCQFVDIQDSTSLYLTYTDYLWELQRLTNSAFSDQDLENHYGFISKQEKQKTTLEFARLILSQLKSFKTRLAN